MTTKISQSPKGVHNCLKSVILEGMFTKKGEVDLNLYHDDECPICLLKLKEIPVGLCCSSHVRETLCGHMFHVGCLFDHNPNPFFCPLCQQDLRILSKQSK